MSGAIPALMSTNVYSVRGRVLVVGTCLPQVWPEAFGRLAGEADQVYALCLEETHVNMAITKLSAIFGAGRLESLTFASVDRSPHCTQLHYITHEVERLLPDHVPVADYVVSGGRLVRVPEKAIELSKSLALLAGRVARGDRPDAAVPKRL